MSRGIIAVLTLLFTGCVAFNTIDIPIKAKPSRFQERVVQEEPAPQGKIALIDIDGVISDDSEDSLFSSRDSLVVAVVEKLKMAEADANVKAVILRMNTPGGEVTASDILYSEVRAFQKRKPIPVVAVFMGVSASGGYYIASACDRIVAHPTTITGSIGVVAMHVSLAGLLDKIGVKVEALKSGEHKDMGSIFKDLGEEDRKLLQDLINSMYDRFVGVVVQGRRGQLNEEQVRKLADGRIYTADQALEAKLIDKIGYLKDAVEEAKSLAGMKSAVLVLYSRKPQQAENVYSVTQATSSFDPGNVEWARRILGMRLFYIWEPYLLGK